MTRKRVTASEKKQRHEWAIRQIDAGMGLSELTALTAETWGCSHRTARDVTAKAHKDWIEAFNHQDINQRDLLFQCLGRLERTARKAEESGNFASRSRRCSSDTNTLLISRSLPLIWCSSRQRPWAKTLFRQQLDMPNNLATPHYLATSNPVLANERGQK